MLPQRTFYYDVELKAWKSTQAFPTQEAAQQWADIEHERTGLPCEVYLDNSYTFLTIENRYYVVIRHS